MTNSFHRGFSLIELLIVIAVLGIVVAVGVPAYRGYIETAQMSKVNAAYEFAVRASRDEFAKDTSRTAMGLQSTLPQSSAEWIELFDPGGLSEAPGGGPAFIEARANRRFLTDPDTTGAIHVRYNRRRQWLDIGRPAYAKLDAFRARVTRDDVDTRSWPED